MDSGGKSQEPNLAPVKSQNWLTLDYSILLHHDIVPI